GVPKVKGEFAVTIAASNAYGTGFADLALTISAATPTIMRQPQDVTAMANKHASFTVTAKSTTKLSYQWLKNDQAIPGATGHMLMLRKVTAVDAGTYCVIVTNAAGSVQSDSATLTVLTPYTPGSTSVGKGSGTTGEKRDP
ncbi:MAG TPA: immunoglobulin domain-containing protein, partial [Opitutaceae bacterium]